MEQKITKAIRNLKLQFYLFWLFPVLLMVAFETELLPVGAFANAVQIQFILENLGILFSIIAVPVALKLFSFVLIKKINTYSFPVALNKYVLWSSIRLGILGMVALYNIIVYYFTLNNIGGLCALIALTASLFCYPGEKRLYQELNLPQNDEE